MAKTASQSVGKWQNNAGVSADEYIAGARNPKRSQSAAAIASKQFALQAIQEAFNSGRWEAGLRRSGDAGWFEGVEQKGANNYPTGISSQVSATKYMERSGRYDSARRAAEGSPRGGKGSAQNLARVQKVVAALRAAKVGTSAPAGA
mgnify:CR=1 FL=1